MKLGFASLEIRHNLVFVIIKQEKIRLCHLNAVVMGDWAELAFKGINEKPPLHMSKTSGISLSYQVRQILLLC